MLKEDYGQYFNKIGSEAIIIRPDYYIFGSTSSLTNLPLLVEDLYKQMKKFMNTATASYQAF